MVCNKTVVGIKVDLLYADFFWWNDIFQEDKICCEKIYAQRSYVVLPFGKRMYLFLLKLHMNGWMLFQCFIFYFIVCQMIPFFTGDGWAALLRQHNGHRAIKESNDCRKVSLNDW